MHACTVKFNLLTCLCVYLVHTIVFMNIAMYILTNNYTAVILISTYQAIFVTDNGSRMWWVWKDSGTTVTYLQIALYEILAYRDEAKSQNPL